jgi:uncharacterized protein (UPF0303 family)
MGVSEDIEAIARQESALTFDRFDENVAWALGLHLRARATAGTWPVLIEVWTFGRPLFLAALAGSTPDNVDWARRKRNVVERFRRSSYAVGLDLQRKVATLEGRYGLAPSDHAAHGGGFPLSVEGAGIVGTVVVSGLPQREDHMAVVRALCFVQGREAAPFELDGSD